MAGAGGPEGHRTIDHLIDAGDFEGARGLLAEFGEGSPVYTLLGLKLELREGSMAPGAVESRVVQLLRQDPNIPGARELYQEASTLAYRQGQSSLAHSHPPPPVKGPPDRGSGDPQT